MTLYYDQNQLYQDLYNLGYNDLINKYNLAKMLEQALGFNEDGHSLLSLLQTEAYIFVYQFMPENSRAPIEKAQKKYVLDAVSTATDPAQLKAQLLQLSPNLVVPNDFNLPEKKNYALKIKNAFDNLRRAMVDQLYYEYESDVINLYRQPEDKIKNLIAENDNLVNIINEDLKKINDVQSWFIYDLRPEIIERVASFFTQIGRTAIFINQIKENPKAEKILNILTKFGTAAQIVLVLKHKNITEDNIVENIKKEIKEYLYSKIDF